MDSTRFVACSPVVDLSVGDQVSLIVYGSDSWAYGKNGGVQLMHLARMRGEGEYTLLLDRYVLYLVRHVMQVVIRFVAATLI